MPRKRKPNARREKGQGSYRYDSKTERHIWRITQNGKRYEVADRDATRARVRFDEILDKLKQQIDIHGGGQSLTQFMERYLHTVAINKVGDSTLHDYAKRASRSILPTLGHYRLDALNTELIQAWINAMQTDRAASSVKQALALLNRALDQAVDERLLKSNPAKAVSVSTRRAVQHNEDDEALRVLTHEATAQMMHAVKGTMYELLYTLAVEYGLRRGELLGLRWKDIDLDKMTIKIRQQVRQMDTRIEITSELKTKTARRILPFDRDLLPLFSAQHARVATWRLRCGPAWLDNDLVFPNEHGKWRRPDNLTQHFARLMKRLDLDHHLHDLRATCVTRMRERGVDAETVARWVGHSTPLVTLIVYSEPDMDRMRAALKKKTGT